MDAHNRSVDMDDSFDSMESDDMRTTPEHARAPSHMQTTPSFGTGMPTTPSHEPDDPGFGSSTVRSLNSSFESMPSPEPHAGGAAMPSGARTAPMFQRTVSHLSNDVTPPSSTNAHQHRGAATVHRGGNIPRPQQEVFAHLLLSSKKKGRESMQRQSVPPPHAPVKSPLPRRLSGGRASLPAHLPQGVVQPQRTQSISEDDLCEANFVKIRELGKGSFGSVYLVERRSESAAPRRRRRRYALKISQHGLYSVHQRTQWFTEAKAMAECNHRNVVQCVGAWVENHRMFILAEYCEFGSLKDYIETLEGGALDEDDIWYILHDVAAGLQHIHSKNLLHLDIKPENLFLSRHVDGVNLSQGSSAGGVAGGACIELKVGDFGLAVQNATADAEGGDSRYMAPELLNEEPEARAPPADVFSLGATIFELCANVVMPHSNENWERIRTLPVLQMIEEGMQQNAQDGVLFERSEELCVLTACLMDPTPGARPTLEQVLAHPRVQATRRPTHHPMVDSLLLSRSDSVSSSEDVMSTPPAAMTHSSSYTGAHTMPASFLFPGDAGAGVRSDETPDTVRGGVLHDEGAKPTSDEAVSVPDDDEMGMLGVRRTLF